MITTTYHNLHTKFEDDWVRTGSTFDAVLKRFMAISFFMLEKTKFHLSSCYYIILMKTYILYNTHVSWLLWLPLTRIHILAATKIQGKKVWSIILSSLKTQFPVSFCCYASCIVQGFLHVETMYFPIYEIPLYFTKVL